MFGMSKLKAGSFVFVVKRDDTSNYIVIGRIVSEVDKVYRIRGTFIRPIGLIERIRAGRAQGKPIDALNNPDPNNCVFFIIDTLDTGNFDEEVDPRIDKITPINENRYFVLDGWIKESMPELFSNYFNSASADEKSEARSILINRMNSLMSQELKEHVYAVARSSQIL
ncbi:hypothetical protein [Candidatus Nitrosocosmicus hydrocola]|uniref:hypothetical protein n=1 Tax=Candidatus Nitrosocosmicus hydrocola TaxID=1826872 RepID=UPI0011E5F10E|nr:hypothetical protein [Candidatus Nitrosocosmicus hydrocola]